ncbi:hypothetical protein [Streptomyces cavernae]|uniref:hypothetical protein n=1 Tax=Streptomyces cavernae TaxID=2259034 RepID=UPI000FEC1DC3|nr:hypothetical protein [Streptomyces cavernae]
MPPRGRVNLRCLAIGLVASAAFIPFGASGSVSADDVAPSRSRVLSQSTQPVSVNPVQAKDFRPAVKMSAAEAEAIRERLHANREKLAASVPQKNIEAPRTPAAAASHVRKGTRAPGTLVIGRNNKNTVANTNTCGTGSTLAEPAAANEGPHVFASGNLSHQEFSTNGGATWNCASAFPAGPAEAPIPWGDTDVVYDHSRSVTFHSVMYLNSSATNGVVRVFVRRSIPAADNCSYTLDFDPSATNVIPDYPHLGLSNDFLYVSANRVSPTAWLGASLRRLNLDQMASCVGASGSSVNFTNAGGQRVLVPGHGARDVMYFSWVNTPTQWRVFSWADNSASVLSTFVNVASMTFGDADCRGGANNTDWSSPLATGIVGFNVRTSIGNDHVNVWVPTANDASHPHAYVRGARFRVGSSQSALSLVQQPEIWFTDQCAGTSTTGVNDRGDEGLAIALGGRKGGGGPAVATAITMKDQFSPGPGGFSFTTVAAATHNPTNNRFGDYFTVRRQAPCGEFFTTTGYGLLNGTAVANVNSRYVEFGRGRDEPCYLAWRNSVPAA